MIRLTRRNFLRASFLLSSSAACAGCYARIIEPNLTDLVSYTLYTPKWPKEYAPLKLAIASDFHIGCPAVDFERMSKEIERINSMDVDCVLLLGDFQNTKGSGIYGLNGSLEDPKKIGEVFAALNKPGYAVLGNHDWNYDCAEEIAASLDNSGVRTLENESQYIELGSKSFWLGGLADHDMRTPDYKKTLSNVFNKAPVIMLAHSPESFPLVDTQPVVTLCGHTHGGQLAIDGRPIYTPSYYKVPDKYNYGYIREGNKDLIVTSGIGTSALPIRFGARPEIVHLTIQSSDQAIGGLYHG